MKHVASLSQYAGHRRFTGIAVLRGTLLLWTWIVRQPPSLNKRCVLTYCLLLADQFKSIGSFYCQLPASAMTKRTGPDGEFWAVDLNIVITVGTVEVKAYVEWEEMVSFLLNQVSDCLIQL